MAGGQVVATVEGLRQLRSALRRAGDDLSDFRDANADVARVAGQAAQVDAPHRTGTLAGSVRWSGTKTQAIVRAGSARVPYAGPIQWGWPARHIRPALFVTQAASRTEPQWLDLFMDAINRIIDKIGQEAHP